MISLPAVAILVVCAVGSIALFAYSNRPAGIDSAKIARLASCDTCGTKDVRNIRLEMDNGSLTALVFIPDRPILPRAVMWGERVFVLKAATELLAEPSYREVECHRLELRA